MICRSDEFRGDFTVCPLTGGGSVFSEIKSCNSPRWIISSLLLVLLYYDLSANWLILLYSNNVGVGNDAHLSIQGGETVNKAI